MAIWNLLVGSAAGLLLGGPLGALAGGAVGAAVDGVRAIRANSPQRRQVAFTIAAIALAAKMARADGHASDDEAAVVQRLFRVPESERDHLRRFYRLAQQSMAGFEVYARQAAELLGPGSPVLEDLLEALLMIAVVDGVHPAELRYLEQVAAILGFAGASWLRIRARHIALDADDPWVVLGLPPGAPAEAIRAAYRRLARAHHPDRHMAEGTPPEFIHVAEARMASINAAYAQLLKPQARAAAGAAADVAP